MSKIDISRVPLGEMAGGELVAAVAQVGDLAERHYLEIKGPIEITSAEGKSKIAKFILGASNRDPNLAAKAFGGHAVLMIGVSKDTIEGVPQIEHLEIQKAVMPYLGPKSPGWDVQWVPVANSSNKVLLVVVDPPNPRLAPFFCWKQGEGIYDGRVYIRVDGATREATAAETAAMIERSRAASQPTFDFDVRVRGIVRGVTIDTDSTLDTYISATRKRLLDAIPRSEPPVPLSMTDLGRSMTGFNEAIGKMAFEIPEERSKQEYRDEIQQWENELRSAWPDAVSKLARFYLTPPVFIVENQSDIFCEDVQLVLSLAADTTFADYPGRRKPIGPSQIGIHHPPRAWGPQKRDLGGSYFSTSMLPRPFDDTPFELPAIRRHGDGLSTIVIDVGDVRPKATVEVENDEFVLVRTGGSAGPIVLSWSITARGVNQVFEGESLVEEGDDLDLSPIFNRLVSRH